MKKIAEQQSKISPKLENLGITYAYSLVRIIVLKEEKKRGEGGGEGEGNTNPKSNGLCKRPGYCTLGDALLMNSTAV